MIYKIFSAVLPFAFAALLSCNANDDTKNTGADLQLQYPQTQQGQNGPIRPVQGNSPFIQGVNPSAFVPVSDSVSTNVPQINNLSAPAAAVAAAPTGPVNPAHGKPGHVCELPVGAPLNSKATIAAPAGSTSPNAKQPNLIVGKPTEVKTAPGMNPPHGKPGHRCEISVGAPLNSMPANVSTTPTVIQPNGKTIDGPSPSVTGTAEAPKQVTSDNAFSPVRPASQNDDKASNSDKQVVAPHENAKPKKDK